MRVLASVGGSPQQQQGRGGLLLIPHIFANTEHFIYRGLDISDVMVIL